MCSGDTAIFWGLHSAIQTQSQSQTQTQQASRNVFSKQKLRAPVKPPRLPAVSNTEQEVGWKCNSTVQYNTVHSRQLVELIVDAE